MFYHYQQALQACEFVNQARDMSQNLIHFLGCHVRELLAPPGGMGCD